jgi:cytochrome oxidase assembly protein ShyY1
MDWLTRQMGYHFLPDVLWLESGETYGLVRDWPQFDKGREQMPPEKHMSYAFQWFSLAVALCVIYIVVNLKKTED